MITDYFSSARHTASTAAVQPTMSRRLFIKTSAQVAAGLLIPAPLVAGAFKPQKLSFYHTHTGERLKLEYSPDRYSSSARREFEYFLRDFRTGDTHTIDHELLNILSRIQQCCDSRGTYEIISGYRSPQTNSSLRKNSSGVAKKSLHMKGQAIDLRLTDLPTSMLRDVAKNLHNGGVGYYASSNFVHLDTGHKRAW